MNLFKYFIILLVFSSVFYFSLENKKSFANQNLSSSNTSLKPAVKAKNNLDFYTRDLIKAGKNVTRGNYENIIYQKVCPYMSRLKSFETKGQVDKKKRKRFLEVVVGLYDQALNLSSEYYLMSCIYNYYGSSAPGELMNIGKKVLSDKNQREMRNLLKLYETEDREGNGDDPKGFTYSTDNRSKTSLLLPLEDYEQLSKQAQLTYIQKTKSYYLDFEKEVIESLPVQPESVVQFPILNFLIIPAVANEFKGKCLIGGVIRKTVYSKRLKRQACPIFGRACNGSTDNFQCGGVFNNKCISINPVKSISQRCYEAAKDEPVNSEQYEEYRGSVESILNQYCVGKRKRYAGCRHFRKRMEDINKETQEDIQLPFLVPRRRPPGIERQATPDTGTEATAPCTDCHESNSGVAREVEGLNRIVGESSGNTEELVDYFSNNIFENSKCNCTGNDGCTKGCQHSRHLDRTESPPVNRCRGQKPMGLSKAKCARHVTGAIMKTVHHFLGRYCEGIDKISENRNDYAQCVEDFDSNQEKNICEHGIIFPSALCALNLDGQSADAYNNIGNRGVRNKCKAWNGHNEALLSINIKQDDGTLKRVPLFKKMSPDKLGQFQSDTSQIPPGSIVVSKSPSRHGHVEIKTNRNECGPGNNQACFCSDYCRDRQAYDETFNVQAVFQWNPEIVKYIKEND